MGEFGCEVSLSGYNGRLDLPAPSSSCVPSLRSARRASHEKITMANFFQDPPVLANQYDDDHVLRRYLTRRLPREVLAEIEPDLHRFGQRVVGDVLAMGDDANAHEPELVQFDPWGRRIDRIDLAHGWHDLERSQRGRRD